MSAPPLILGAGAFGTALAVALAGRGPVDLWARAPEALRATRASPHLPGISLPDRVRVLDRVPDAGAGPVLVAVPMKALAGVLAAHRPALAGRAVIACCKGVDPQTLGGPATLIATHCPEARPALLSGPGFAADIARGLPTALTLACADDGLGGVLQAALSTPALRLYRSTDVIGVELGGALKNVIAIAAGMVMGAGLGESARAALMTRGYAEMVRIALRIGASAETLAGLSGLGDLVLTCTSDKSRNFRHGLALGAGTEAEPGATVEGIATAAGALGLAGRHGLELPVTAMVAAVTGGRLTVAEAVERLMSRPLRQE